MQNEKSLGVIQFIQQRNSAVKLTTPGPSASEIEELIKSALRAPDHAKLMPARFIQIEGEAREALGDLFIQASTLSSSEPLTADNENALKAMPMRAPLILVAVASIQEHPKVPEIEQLLSVGCSVQNILLTVEALGYRAIWRTGEMAFDSAVHEGLRLNAHEKIIGFIYIGTLEGKAKTIKPVDVSQHLSSWP